MTPRTWLETAEYTLVLGSLVGTVVAAVSQQMLAAVLPLSLALVVNLIQRTQLAASQQQLLLQALTSLNQRYSTDMRFLRRRLQDVALLPEAVNLTPLEQALQELQQALGRLQGEMNQRLASVEHLTLDPLYHQLQQLQEQYRLLFKGLSDLTQQIDQLPPAQRVSRIEQGFEQLQRQTAQLQAQVQQLRQTPVVDVRPLEAQIQALSQQISAPQTLHAQIITLETATQQLQAAVQQLGEEVKTAKQVQDIVGRLDRELQRQSQLAPLVQQLRQELAQIVTQTEKQQHLTQTLAQDWQSQFSEWERQKDLVQQLQQKVQTLQEQADGYLRRAALLPLVTAVERLHQQQTQQQQQLEPLAAALTALQAELTQLQSAVPDPTALASLQATLDQLQQQMEQVRQAQTEQLAQVKTELARTQAQLQDLPQLHQQLTDITQLVTQIDHSHGDLREYTQTLATRQSQMEQQWQAAQTQLQQVPQQVADAVQTWAEIINQHLRQIPQYQYELVADRFGAREVLQQALTQTTQELILVSPWLSQQVIDRAFIQALRRLLSQGVRVYIGWGDAQDIKNQELRRNAQNRWRDGPGRFSWKYNALADLEQLEQEFPDQFHLKLIGTHEHYLVSDDRLALLGSHALLGGNHSNREISLKTSDPHLCQDLRKRFHRATDLDAMPW
ncbi:MAG: phospholipase D-like domain-containing protein [Gloeomargarita sp. SKYB31]|nr:phospholipase D-like domain-containing protein [Gloeomargarita sp. SKYB31]